MKNLIVITENCSEDSQTNAVDYDRLPANVKVTVDLALKNNNSIQIDDIYQDGMQSIDIDDWNLLTIPANEEVFYMGSIVIWDRD